MFGVKVIFNITSKCTMSSKKRGKICRKFKKSRKKALSRRFSVVYRTKNCFLRRSGADRFCNREKMIAATQEKTAVLSLFSTPFFSSIRGHKPEMFPARNEVTCRRCFRSRRRGIPCGATRSFRTRRGWPRSPCSRSACGCRGWSCRNAWLRTGHTRRARRARP